jgi:excinuclease ABC subunit C
VSVLPSLPSSPGVYWFLDANNTVLYVGKAKNLRNRVRSYTHFLQLADRTKQLVKVATKVKFTELGSDLEAILTEAELIRRYQPAYNILLKDDKSPLYIHITDEKFPRVLRIRKKELNNQNPKGTILGPFPSAYRVREVLQIVRRIFPWCNEAGDRVYNPDSPVQMKPCFFYHIDLCPGACYGKISPESYRENIYQLTRFLRGKTKAVTSDLKAQMTAAVAAEDFENAARLRDMLTSIEIVTKPTAILKPELTTPALTAQLEKDGLVYLQDILAEYMNVPRRYPLDRIEGYDVSNTMGTNPSVAMVTFTEGKPDKAEYRLFNIRSIHTPNDYQMMKEALARRQNHPEWGYPNLVVIDGGKGQVRAALSVWTWGTPLIGIAKNPDRLIIPKINWNSRKKDEKPDLRKPDYHVLKLQENHPGLQLIQRIRNESHRFSKKQHTRRRLKSMFT